MPASSFNDFLQTVFERGRTLLGRSDPISDADLKALSEDLLSEKGEASGVALARLILDAYEVSPPEKRLSFWETLAELFGPNGPAVDKAIANYQETPSETTLCQLYVSAEPRRQELLRRLNLAPNGTGAMVQMRAELLKLIKEKPHLKVVDTDFVQLFSSWFNRGFLELHALSWDSPASVLEKLIRYEAVHQIGSWDDLRRRLEPSDRRCFSFFHPRLADEPLIFVEVALTKEIPDKIEPLLAEKRDILTANETTTAVFYSISNTQKGLAGVSFGNFLIKQVAEDLKRDLPNLKTFVTLSPVPGFGSWLDQELASEVPSILSEKLRAKLEILKDDEWWQDEKKKELAKKALMPAAACYFLRAKTPADRPVDPVARFHLRNGARLERMNFLGNSSAKALKQSYGIMVNYLYALEDVERNHESFATFGEVVASSAIKKLANAADD